MQTIRVVLENFEMSLFHNIAVWSEGDVSGVIVVEVIRRFWDDECNQAPKP